MPIPEEIAETLNKELENLGDDSKAIQLSEVKKKIKEMDEEDTWPETEIKILKEM